MVHNLNGVVSCRTRDPATVVLCTHPVSKRMRLCGHEIKTTCSQLARLEVCLGHLRSKTVLNDKLTQAAFISSLWLSLGRVAWVFRACTAFLW